jgi:hypothetical protein
MEVVLNIGTPLLQRLTSLEDGKYWRKDIGKKTVERRGFMITTSLRTAASKSGTMGAVIDELDDQKDRSYNLFTHNCQDFANDLAEYLSGIGVLHTSTSWGGIFTPIIGLPFAPVWNSQSKSNRKSLFRDS